MPFRLLRVSDLIAVTLATPLCLAGPVDAKPKAGITIAQARSIALARVPGRILDEQSERERGRRVYSFEIAASGALRGTIKEVVVDARDGSVVAIEDEREEDDD